MYFRGFMWSFIFHDVWTRNDYNIFGNAISNTVFVEQRNQKKKCYFFEIYRIWQWTRPWDTTRTLRTATANDVIWAVAMSTPFERDACSKKRGPSFSRRRFEKSAEILLLSIFTKRQFFFFKQIIKIILFFSVVRRQTERRNARARALKPRPPPPPTSCSREDDRDENIITTIIIINRSYRFVYNIISLSFPSSLARRGFRPAKIHSELKKTKYRTT